MKKAAGFCVFLWFGLSGLAFPTAQTMHFGPYDLKSAVAPGWDLDQSSAVNHIVRLGYRTDAAEISIVPEFLPAHELRSSAAKILKESNETWLILFKKNHPTRHLLEEEIRSDKAFLQATYSYDENGGKHYVRSIYRWFPKQKMLLTLELSAQSDVWPQASQMLSEMDQSILPNAGYKVSPCVRIYFMGRRFNHYLQAYGEGRNEWLTQKREQYKTDMLNEMSHRHGHCWAYNFFLAYLESFNSKNEYLGKGSYQKEAQAYLQKGLLAYPGGKLSLELKSLPALWLQDTTQLTEV